MTEGGALPVIGVSSASAATSRDGYQATYHLYRVRRSRAGWDVRMVARIHDGEGFQGTDPHRLQPGVSVASPRAQPPVRSAAWRW